MKYSNYLDYVKQKHGNQKRKQGTPYYLHPVEVSKMLKEKGFEENYQVAGLFHDLLEDTKTTYEEILQISNEEVAETVKLVTKEDGYMMKEYIERISKNDMAKMVKLADRIHNLSEVHLAPKEFRKRYIMETEQWYINLAKETVFEEDLKIVLEKEKQAIL